MKMYVKRTLRKNRKLNITLTNEIMKNHATLILEIKLLLENGKRTRLYSIMIQFLMLFIVKKAIWLLLEGMVMQQPETVRFLKRFLKICWMIVIQIMKNKKNEIHQPELNITWGRSTRIRNMPKRYEDYNMS